MVTWRSIPKHKLAKVINLWPPFLGAGIRLEYLSADFHEARVGMKLTKFNTNYVGVHFGGSLYSMSDPWYMLMLLEILGKDFIVWDKAASIRFKKPGKGKVWAHFKITAEMLDSIRADVAQHGKTERVWPVEIKNEQQEVVALVDKTLWIAAKRK
jgi:acyl-coenzyme A thioesterase PaaI-like protein